MTSSAIAYIDSKLAWPQAFQHVRDQLRQVTKYHGRKYSPMPINDIATIHSLIRRNFGANSPSYVQSQKYLRDCFQKYLVPAVNKYQTQIMNSKYYTPLHHAYAERTRGLNENLKDMMHFAIEFEAYGLAPEILAWWEPMVASIEYCYTTGFLNNPHASGLSRNDSDKIRKLFLAASEKDYQLEMNYDKEEDEKDEKALPIPIPQWPLPMIYPTAKPALSIFNIPVVPLTLVKSGKVPPKSSPPDVMEIDQDMSDFGGVGFMRSKRNGGQILLQQPWFKYLKCLRCGGFF